MARITLAGEDLIAQKQAAQQPLNITRFIFANVPGLSPNNEVDRAAPKPPAGQVVYSAEIPPANKGYVNPSQVVYSLQVGSDVGDWDFNWIGLESAEGVLFAVAYMPLQQKRRNIPPLQLGNNITRNFLVVFDGAQALTGITIDASTWQHDFTVRLAGIDERERQSNRDFYGRACFFGSALQLEKVGDTYQLKPGSAYVEGVRVQRATALPVVPPALPTTAWLDVALQRELNDVMASWGVVWGTGKVDYVDSAGVQHYCVAIADLPNSNTITDSRPVENIAGPLVAHFAARVGDYAGLRARATTKDDVGLGNLPNAISSAIVSDSTEVLSTTRMVQGIHRALLGELETKAPKATTLSGYGITDDVQIRTEPLTGKFTVECLDVTSGESPSGILIRTALPANEQVMPHLTFKGCINGYTAPFEMHLSWYFYNGKIYSARAFISCYYEPLANNGIRVFLSHENGLVNIRLDFGRNVYIPRLTITALKTAYYGGNYAFYTGWSHTPWNWETAIAGEVMATFHSVLSTANTGATGQALAKASTPVDARSTLGISVADGGLGYGQVWQDVTASRAWNTTYTNTTGKPIQVSLAARDTVAGNLSIELFVSGVNIANHYLGASTHATVSAIVPPGETYRVERRDTNDTITSWAELR